MANETAPTNEYPIPVNSYAAFDSISIRNLIIERLNQQGIYTDQNYIGSNLSSFIDVISYVFNTLMFYLNKTSNEAVFSESQIYENITKIVSLLDYKPIGFQTSTVSIQCSATNFTSGIYNIPRYSFLALGQQAFSFAQDARFIINETGLVTQELTDLSNKQLLFQGTFKEYSNWTSSGEPNETFILNLNDQTIDHFNMDVYVWERDSERWYQYTEVSSLYANRPSSKTYERRLSTQTSYEFMFGNGINGRRLQEGDKIAVFYLQSSGENGIIGPNQLNQAKLTLFSSSQYSAIMSDLGNVNTINSAEANNLAFSNTTGSTFISLAEGTQSIKKNAVSNFKGQYRLVTKEDYETYIRINYNNFLSDVKVFTNWEYAGKYLKYFKDHQVSPAAYRQIPLNHILYSDSCNFNNIYICAIPKLAKTSTLKYLLPAQKELILTDIQQIKTLTSDVIFLDPILKMFSLGIASTGVELNVEDRQYCYLNIRKSSRSARSNRSIQNEVVSVFKDFFNSSLSELGKPYLHDKLTTSLFSIEGIEEITTIREDTNESFGGVSLFCWNPIMEKYDKKVVTSNFQMLDFEYFYFEDLSNLFNKIKIV